MLKFISFGSGSSGNCYYLSNGQDAIIIDAGVGIRAVKKNFLKYGINPAKIKAILVTHDHMDHSRTVGALSRLLNVKVYSSAEVLKKLNWARLSRVEPDACVAVDEEETFCVGSMEITPFRLPHDAVDNYGYSISDQGQVFTVMTDVGKPTDNVSKYIGCSDYLVLEADYDDDMLAANPRYEKKLKERIKGGKGHLSNRQAAQVLLENYHEGLQSVWLCHLSEENNTPELARTTVARFLGDNGISTETDLRLEVLSRRTVSGPWLMSDKGISADHQLKVDFDF